MTIGRSVSRPGWHAKIRRRLVTVTAANPPWGTARKPLYARSKTGSAREISTTVLDRTPGDAVIASVALIVALVLVGTPVWPDEHVRAAIAAASTGSVTGTTYGGYANTVTRRFRDYKADATAAARQRLIEYLKAATR